MAEQGVQVLVLGELTLIQDGLPVTVPGSRKTRALMAYLLLRNRPVTREHLCELLWPHPDNPRAALRWSLTKLRPVINAHAEHLIADRTSVAIKGLENRVDLGRIDRLLRQPVERIATEELLTGAELFHGELLEGLEIPDCHRFNEWLIARSEAARKARRTILETLTSRLVAEPEQALVHARARVALDPLDEGAHVDVVRLLGALGRNSEAHEQAARCREILAVELGADPGPRLAVALAGLKRSSHPAPAIPETVPATRRTADAGLFGRAEECIRLENFLSSPNQEPVLYLEGDPGIGKSRLLDELRRRAEIRGTRVLTGRSWEVGMVRPFGVWIDLLTGLPPDLVPPELRSDLAPLIPALGETGQYNGERDRLFGAVEKLVINLSLSERALVLVFDDIHWIDQASVELLSHLTSKWPDLILGLACAGRPGEMADNEPARALVRTWNRAGRLERMPLAPLPDRDAAALARSLSVGPDIDLIVSACGGNPLYLIESAREESGTSPGSVASLVSDRLAVLDDPTREVARWAALLGHDFPAERLAELLAQPLADFLARTETLERHGFLHPHGEGWDFAHDLLRRVTLAEVSAPRRTLMHRRVAHAMASEPDPDGSLASEMAFHAGRGAEPEMAARAFVTAGDRALGLAAFHEAWRIADRGLVEVAKLPEDTSLELHVELLRVFVLAGMGRKRKVGTTRQLEDLASRAHLANLHAAERTARWLLSVIAEEAGDFDAARRHSLSAEKASRPADSTTRLRALANTARCLVQLEREPNRAADLLAEAQKLAGDSPQEILDIPWGLGLLHSMGGRTGAALTALEHGTIMARDQKNHWAWFECLSRMSMLDLASGNPAGVEERDGELRTVAAKMGEGSEIALADTLLALSRWQEGKDQPDLEAALAELRAADSKGLLAFALNEAARLSLAEGDAPAAIRYTEEALTAAEEVGRHHQQDRAMLYRSQAALLAGDEEFLIRFLEWAETTLETLNPEWILYGQINLLREEVINRREKEK